MMPSGPPEFILVTGLKCSYGKISGPLTEISVAKTANSIAESARPLKYEHIENFTKNLEVRRDLGNRASPVNRAHVKRPILQNLTLSLGKGGWRFSQNLTLVNSSSCFTLLHHHLVKYLLIFLFFCFFFPIAISYPLIYPLV